jgi:S-formylglutathione hydrolase FrmB
VRKLGIAVLALAALGVTAPADAQEDPRLVELSLPSAAVGRDIGVRVLLPAGWTADRTWPLLLLLHGAGDDHRTWTNNTDVEGLTAAHPFVVVMPEGGRNAEAGWYSDWAGDGPPDWETFHLRELLPEMERRFSAGGARERRVVAGLSMGGFGAMSYAARHPDLFVGAASFSGAVDTTAAGPGGALVFEQLSPTVGTPSDRVWGPYETSEIVWRGHNPTDLATNLRPLTLWARTGNGVPLPGDQPQSAPVEAGVYTMNLSFHDRLTRAGIAHDFFDRGHGVHDWPYWEADLAAVLPGLAALVVAPPPPPATFDYRFVEDAAEVFGWRFTLAGRSGPAFSELTSIGGDGLTAAGIGTLTATAPDGRSVTAALTSTPTRLLLPVAQPATTTTAAAPAAAAPAPATGTRALARTGGTGAWAGAALLGVALALSAGRRAPRAPAVSSARPSPSSPPTGRRRRAARAGP